MQHFVRVGILGHVGRYLSADGIVYPRGTRVVCRTSRGIEVGEVLSRGDCGDGEPDGTLLRRVAVSDDLLLSRLERNKQRALVACQQLLEQRAIPAALIDVEQLFDGRSLCFYFLGEITPELDALTAELAEAYDAEVQFRRFADTLTQGCGPHCGTELAAGGGCGSGGCASCAVVGACGTGHRGAGAVSR